MHGSQISWLDTLSEALFLLEQYGMVLMSLTWLFLIPNLRMKFLCKNSIEHIQLPVTHVDKEEYDNDINSSTDGCDAC